MFSFTSETRKLLKYSLSSSCKTVTFKTNKTSQIELSYIQNTELEWMLPPKVQGYSRTCSRFEYNEFLAHYLCKAASKQLTSVLFLCSKNWKFLLVLILLIFTLILLRHPVLCLFHACDCVRISWLTSCECLSGHFTPDSRAEGGVFAKIRASESAFLNH